MKSTRITCIIFLLLFALKANAAEFSLAHIYEPSCDNAFGSKVCVTILMEGEIVAGDEAKLRNGIKRTAEIIAKKLKLKARVGKINLNSKGGDLYEAMRVGRLIRSELISTQVTQDSSCHSSCVIAFLGGVQRIPAGKTGIHSFYSKEFLGDIDFSAASSKYNEVSKDIEQYLKELRIPTSLLDEMKKIPGYNVKVLEFDELEQYGILGIDPVYAQIKSNTGLTK